MLLFLGSPGVLLRDILYGASEPEETLSTEDGRDAMAGLQTPDVRQLLAALESRGMSEEKGGSPGAEFILQLFERLQAGESLVQALGGKETSLKQADTIRTFTVSGEKSFFDFKSSLWYMRIFITFRFYTSRTF